MNGAPSLTTTAAALARGWHSFFHKPCDPRIPAAIRIAYATIVLMHFAVLYPDLDLWFTASGVLPADVAPKVTSPFATAPLDVGFAGAKFHVYPPGALLTLLLPDTS